MKGVIEKKTNIDAVNRNLAEDMQLLAGDELDNITVVITITVTVTFTFIIALGTTVLPMIFLMTLL